jgi:hypothetical protein
MDLSAPNILKGIAVVLVGAICFGTVVRTIIEKSIPQTYFSPISKYVPTKRSGRQNNGWLGSPIKDKIRLFIITHIQVLFTQWIMSLGSLPVGFAIYLAAGSARLNLMSIIGGTIWTVGRLWNLIDCISQSSKTFLISFSQHNSPFGGGHTWPGCGPAALVQHQHFDWMGCWSLRPIRTEAKTTRT